MPMRHNTRLMRLLFTLLLLLTVASITAQDADDLENNPPADRPLGVTVNAGTVTDGYIIMTMVDSTRTLLLSRDGRIVHYWGSDYTPAYWAYMQPNGNIIRAASLPDPPFGPRQSWSYMNGRVEYLTLEGEVFNAVEFGDEWLYGHHDFAVLPSGNLLMLAYDRYDAEAALAAGRTPDTLPENDEIHAEALLEIDPQTGAIVWEWRVWDHLIQHVDPDLPNYGDPAQHPGRIDINYTDQDISADWIHGNAVSYNAERQEILLSPKNFSEVWIIDHSISTEAARGPAGDLLYRWGNPEAHGMGSDDDQILFGLHNPHWIADGLPGAGNILLYDNGIPGERAYSRIVELAPTFDVNGDYIMRPGQITGPTAPAWSYVAAQPDHFFSSIMSGAQRLPDGNTLIAEGARGRIFEVTASGETVWEYYLPAGARIFRAELYDYPSLAKLDTGQDLSESLGFYEAWTVTCTDGEQRGLYRFLTVNAAVMDRFINRHGADRARAAWELDACTDNDENT